MNMMTLKYLRTLSCEELHKEYKYNREWQLKWFDIYEEYYKQGIRDKDVNWHLENYTKNVNKISRVMIERGM